MTMPLCVNCRFYRRAPYDLVRCTRKDRPRPVVDPVNGDRWESTAHLPQCEDERKRSLFRNTCGPTGKHFQPR